MTMKYFQRFASILEAKIIRDKIGGPSSQGTHKGCAFLRCAYYHEGELIMKYHREAQKKAPKSRKKFRVRSPSTPYEEPSLSSSSRSPPPTNKRKKGPGDEKQKVPEEDTTAPELFDPKGKKVLSRLQVRFADGELERLGIVNLSPIN
jgi:hypothetical protein